MFQGNHLGVLMMLKTEGFQRVHQMFWKYLCSVVVVKNGTFSIIFLCVIRMENLSIKLLVCELYDKLPCSAQMHRTCDNFNELLVFPINFFFINHNLYLRKYDD